MIRHIPMYMPRAYWLQQLFRATFLAPLMMVALSPATAQVPDPVVAAQAPRPGSGHNYLGTDVETVNPSDGSLTIHIPIRTPPGRQLSFPFGIRYSSPEVYHLYMDGGDTLGWLAYAPYPQAGWSYDLPLLTAIEVISYVTYTGNGSSLTQNGQCDASQNYVFRGFDGAQYTLPGLGGIWGDPNYTMTQCPNPPFGPSNAHGILATVPNNSWTSWPGQPPVTVFDQSGTAYYFPVVGPLPALVFGSPYSSSFPWAVLASTVTDRNGNQIKLGSNTSPMNLGSGSYTDTAGRPVVSWNGTQVTVAGLGSNINLDLTTVNESFPEKVTFLPTHQNYTCGMASQGTGQTSEVNEIDVPGNPTQRYTFGYDPTYGKVSQINFPEGGYVQYTWGVNPQSASASIPVDVFGYSEATCQVIYDTPAIVERVVNNGGQNVLQQQFTYSTTWDTTYPLQWDSKTTTVTTTDLVTGLVSVTTYTYGWVHPDTGGPFGGSSYGGQVPVELTVTYQDGAGNTKQIVNKSWLNAYAIAGSQTILDAGPQSRTQLKCYDANEQVLGVYEYGLPSEGSAGSAPSCYTQAQPVGASGFAGWGPLERQTITVTSSQGSCGTNIVDEPCSITVEDGSNNTAKRTVFNYTDSVQSSGASCCLVSPPGAHRGNVLNVQRWLNTSGSPLTTSYAWFDTGQPYSMTDPKGNTTTYCYGDTSPGCASGNTSAYLTQVTYPSTNGVSHIEQFSWNLASGTLASSLDENGQTSSYSYNDPLARLTQVTYPSTPAASYNGSSCTSPGQTSYSHNDAAGAVSVSTSKLLCNGVSATSTAYLNGLGLTTKTIAENGAETDTVYDGLRRVYQVSNPYFTSNDPTYGLTTTLYDPLGRVTSVTMPDQSVVSTSYSANCATVKDENGRSRRSCTDGLARTWQVTEDPGGLGYVTTYQHDPDDNLTGVNQNQGGQLRSFSYDWLSRLTSATNPESGTTTYTYPTPSALCSGDPSTVCTRQDNRGITTTYSYDALNRVTSKTYNDGTTPAASFFYDQAPSSMPAWSGVGFSNAIGRMTVACTGSSAGSCSSPVTAVAYSYDPMGRTTNYWQCTPVNCGTSSIWATSYTYDLAGDLSSWIPPSQFTITQTLNAAQQLTAVTSTLNDAQHPATLLSDAQYNALGDLAQATLANGVIPEYANYNNRGWITGVGAGSGAVLGSGSGSVTISGSPQTRTYNSCPGEPYTCSVIYSESGTVSITVNGVTSTATYGGSETASQIAGFLASAVSSSGAGVSAAASGSTVNIMATSDGPQTDYQLSTAYTFNSPFTTPAFTSSASGSTLTGGGSSQNGTGAYHFTLAHDPVGNVSNANDSVEGNQTFTYDSVNRLSTAVDSGGQGYNLGYGYDAYGNITFNAQNPAGTYTSLTYNPAQNNQLTAIANTTVNYDPAGDMKNDVSCSYTYDGEQRMASATCGGVTTQYVYDGEGQRVAKLNSSGAVSEQDVYNTAGQVIMRYNGSGGWTEGEVWAEGNHLAIYANGQTYFPITDQVGTERARFASTGGIVETCMSQPFGDNLQCTGTDSSPYKFGKLERDTESGDDHAQHRDYNSNPYRWLTPDPDNASAQPSDPQTWNMYAYVRNNPTTITDPDGLDMDCRYGPDNVLHCTVYVPRPQEDFPKAIMALGAIALPQEELGPWMPVIGGGLLLAGWCMQTNCVSNLANLFSQSDKTPPPPATTSTVSNTASPNPDPNQQKGKPDEKKKADDQIRASQKRSPSYHSEYGQKTYGEIKDLAKAGDQKARQMKKLIEQAARLGQRNY